LGGVKIFLSKKKKKEKKGEPNFPGKRPQYQTRGQKFSPCCITISTWRHCIFNQ